MTCPALPVELLLLIMEVASLSTIGKMSRTCLALRHGGVRLLLHRGVSLSAGSSLISFVQFMRSDAKIRFQFLRSLELSTGELRPREVDALLGLISHPLLALDSLTLREAALTLKSIPKHSSTPDISYPTSLTTAFASLRTLRHLTVDQCDRHACSLITAIRSPLKTVSIDFTPLSTWHNSEDAEHQNPIVLLANVSETLEEISATNVGMALDHVMYDVVYPSVRRVNVTYDLTYIPKTVAFTTAFPNLSHLSFTAAYGHPEEVLQAVLGRTANKAHLARHKRSWAHLEELVGCLPDVYILGLGCHVAKLRLTGPISLDAVPALTDVLDDTRPTSLAVSLVGVHLFDDDSLAAMLGHHCAEALRSLEMEVCLDVDEGAVDVQTVLGNVARTLTVLPLRSLTLILNYGLFADEDETGRPMYPAGRAFDSLDLEAAAGLFRTAMPSLVGVVVRRSTDCTWYESMYAAHEDDGSGSSGYISPISPEWDDEFGGFMAEEDVQGW